MAIMSLLARQSRHVTVKWITGSLLVLSVLVVAVKYIAPILYYVSERLAGRPLADVPVMWDFWWPVYLIVAASIYNHSRHAWSAFMLMVIARCLFSVVQLTLFFAQPEWSFWQLQWLFYEVLTAVIMVTGLILALSPAVREEMSTRFRPVSIPA